MKRVILFFFLFASLMQPLIGAEEEGKPSSDQNMPLIPEEFRNLQNQEGDYRFLQEFFRMLVTLGIIIIAIFVLLWILKRMTSTKIEQANLKSPIKIVERRQLSQKTTIYILSLYGKTVTIAESTNGISVLGDVAASPVKQETDLES